ncbi:MAG: hypothetical protein BM555_02165 [Crocinitomix sp. MedPE-SWsnd]|nr:MAG: hypothetical protein BM555_02165 [Crocinitomix sp. MedPE-SWsnd]
MKALKFLALGLLIAAGSLTFAADVKAPTKLQPQKDWVKLGSRVVNMTADHDEILVTIKDGLFTKVRLKVMKAPIHLKNINIVFGNGENKNVKFDKKFAPGTFTRVIDLTGNKRIIKKVKLNYRSVPKGKGRAVVSLFGRR